jgi:hypothetical protein
MKKKITRIILLALVVTILSASAANASSPIPGSTSDPLVSQSYVDERFNRLLSEFQGQLDAFRGQAELRLDDRQMDIIVEEIIRSLAADSGQFMFTPVHIFPGQMLFGEEGTEIIVRSGVVSAIVPGANGLTDLTDGADIMNNVQISHNHLIVIPRADGRGMRAQTEAWVMVKGGFTLMN